LGTAVAALAPRVKAFSNCVLKPWTASPDCCVSLVMSTSSCQRSPSVPGEAGLRLTSSSSSLRVHVCRSNSVWSHCGGRNCIVQLSVICPCRSMICHWWLQTIFTSRIRWEYCTTIVDTSCIRRNTFFDTLHPAESHSRSRSAIIVIWSSRDTTAAWGSVDLDTAGDQLQLQMPTV
jgi:hypothetical protein